MYEPHTLMRAMLGLIACWLAGCLTSQSTICADGTICPANTECDLENLRCIAQGQLDACMGLNDGDECDFAGVTGTCQDRGCVTVDLCGNMVVNPGEVCDDGNRVSNDGCRADCRSNETCGNGVTDPGVGEECDCGGDILAANCLVANSDDAGGICKLDCTRHCGDGVVVAPEFCDGPERFDCADLGFDHGAAVCSNICTPGTAACGAIGWSVEYSGSVLEGQGAWAASDGQLFVVGHSGITRGDVAHWDGTRWTLTEFSYGLSDVWGQSATDVFAVGSGGHIVHFDGTAWTEMDSGEAITLDGVWGRSSSDLFAVGASKILHYDGMAWSVDRNVPEQLRAVHGTASDVFAVGVSGAVWHHNGTLWSEATIPGGPTLRGVWVFDATNVYAVGGNSIFNFDGQDWSEVTFDIGSSGQFWDLWASAPDSVFALSDGAGSSVFHFDGRHWGESALDVGAGSMRGLTGLDSSRVWAAGQSIATFLGSAWLKTEMPQFFSIDGYEDHIIAAGFGTYRYEQGRWTTVPSPFLESVMVGSWGGVYGVVGTDIVHSSSGQSFQSMATNSPQALKDVWFTSPTEGFAVGAMGTIMHYEAGAWVAMESTVTEAINKISGTSASDVWAVGQAGTLLHYDGTLWQSFDQTTRDLRDVWVAASDDVFVAGDGGTMLHYDGTEFLPMESGLLGNIFAVAGTSGNDVFAGTDFGVMVHYDGEQWSPVVTQPTAFVSVIHATDTDVFLPHARSVLRRVQPWATFP